MRSRLFLELQTRKPKLFSERKLTERENDAAKPGQTNQAWPASDHSKTSDSDFPASILAGHNAHRKANIARGVQPGGRLPVNVLQRNDSLVSVRLVPQFVLVAPVLVHGKDGSVGQGKQRHVGRPCARKA